MKNGDLIKSRKNPKPVGRPYLNKDRIQVTCRIDKCYKDKIPLILKQKQLKFETRRCFSDIINSALSLYMLSNNVSIENEFDYTDMID